MQHQGVAGLAENQRGQVISESTRVVPNVRSRDWLQTMLARMGSFLRFVSVMIAMSFLFIGICSAMFLLFPGVALGQLLDDLRSAYKREHARSIARTTAG